MKDCFHRNPVWFSIFTLFFFCMFSGKSVAGAGNTKSRLIVLTDMGNEPDEEQQNIHMPTCSNEFDLERLIAVTGKYLKTNPRPDPYFKLIDAYETVVQPESIQK